METFQQHFEQKKNEFLLQGYSIARVLSEHRESYMVLFEGKEYKAEVTGKLMFTAESRADYPSVGDYVALQIFDEHSPAIIHGILPRKTKLTRKTSGQTFEEQIIASNMDIVFIVHALDETFNVRRIERYIVAVKESGAVPVILLSKTDLLSKEDFELKLVETLSIASGFQIISYSAKAETHMDEIKSLVASETTVCFIGSSGVGKSTLINKLAGEEIMLTRKVRETDAKGRHTTTHRQLIALSGGGFVIDTPGMRELGLWNIGDDTIAESFPEIAELAMDCKFSDCTHVHEPNCAVLAAIITGELSKERYGSYIKLKREAEYIAAKTDASKFRERKAHEKQLNKELREILKLKKKK